MLVRMSNDTNVRLADVARALVYQSRRRLRVPPARRHGPCAGGMHAPRIGWGTQPRRTREVIPVPQQAWSKKRERQYEHIKDGLTDRGRSEDEAEEIAAAHRQQGTGPLR